MSVATASLCPSANPQGEGARVFAVVGGTPAEARATYLERALPLTDEVRALAGPVDPAEVFRVANHCVTGACGHFDTGNKTCGLVRRTVQLMPIVVHRLPRCAIRPECLWWQQEGAQACRRCPQVVTLNPVTTDVLSVVADPHGQ